MRAVLAIAFKDLRLLARDRMALFFALGFPLIMALFFGVISGGGGAQGRMEIAVDDEDRSAGAQALVARLRESPSLEVEDMAADVARDAVRRGKLVAYVKVKPGMALEVGIDPARRAEAGVLHGLLMQARFPAMPGPPVDTVAVAPAGAQPASAFEVTFPSGILWGIIGCVATFAAGMVGEREKGTLARLRVAPLSRTQILAGKATACFLACLGVIALLLAVAHVVFGVRVTNPAALAAAAVSTAVCFVGLMMLVSVLGKTERAAAGASWGAMLPFSMLGGGMIPLIAMPRWMLALSNVSPVKWGIYAMEGAIWRGFSAAEMALPCAILLAVGGAAFGAGVLLSRSQA